jgi:hypothetical protein
MTERWSATERIFRAALERPVEARAAFLAEACGEDTELRREVQSLLDEASSTSFLEQPDTPLTFSPGFAAYDIEGSTLTGVKGLERWTSAAAAP